MLDFLVIKSNEILIISALSVFPITGFVVFFSTLKNYLRIKKNCKVMVEGQIVSYAENKSHNGGSTTYSPVYRYLYNENEYITTSTTYSLENDEIGKVVKLMINPNNPMEISNGEYTSFFMMMYAGIVTFIISLILILVVIIK